MALPIPPDPEQSALLLHLREHERLVLAQDADTMIVMAERWAQLEGTLEAQISLISREITEKWEAGEEVGINRLLQFERYQVLLEQTEREMDRYTQWASEEIATRQGFLGRLGIQHASESVQTGLAEAGFGAGEFFNRLPAESIEVMVGMTGSGEPLGDLLQEAYPESVDHMTQALLDGVVLGLPPGETARNMMDGLAMGLSHLTTIARTEQLRVYREASRQQYAASRAVHEYERVCAKQPKTCIACIGLDGKVYPTNEMMHVHPNDRCFMIPHVSGAEMDERELAKDWFAKQDPELQKQMLGPGKFELYERGMPLQDMVRTSVHPIWGPTVGIASLRDLTRLVEEREPPLVIPSRIEVTGALKFPGEGWEEMSEASMAFIDKDRREDVAYFGADLVEDLAKKGGVPSSEVEEILTAWTESSNSSPDILRVQERAAALFGGELSPWQREQIEGSDPPTAWSDETIDSVLWASYENTQAHLAEAGIGELILYRGVDAYSIGLDTGLELGTELDLTSNAMESWSTDHNVAGGFGDMVISVRVPASRVLSVANTGFGQMNESEVVILNQVGVEDVGELIYSEYVEEEEWGEDEED